MPTLLPLYVAREPGKDGQQEQHERGEDGEREDGDDELHVAYAEERVEEDRAGQNHQPGDHACDVSPWPQVRQETPRAERKMSVPPTQRGVYPGCHETDYYSEYRGAETRAHQEHHDRQQDQDQPAVLALGEHGCPREEDQGDQLGEDPGHEETGNERHRRVSC